MWLLLQVKRDTLQATKYVELLLVADYAEVRNGIVFIPTEHWAQSISPAASPGAGRAVSWSLLSWQPPLAKGEMQIVIWVRAEGSKVAVVSPSDGWESLPSE